MNTIQSIAGNVQSNTEAATYKAESYELTATAVVDQWAVATQATSASDETAAASAMLVTLEDLKAAVVARLAVLDQKAKDADVIEKLKQQIAAGADSETLIATLAACRSVKTKAAAGTSKRSPHPKAPKVHANLAVPDHNDYTWGYTGSLRNLTEQTHPWAKKMPDGSANPDYFRKATDDEIAEMQRRRDEYIKNAG